MKVKEKVKKLVIYYIEYQDTVKFFNGDNTLELIRGTKDKFIENFLRAVYKKYGKNIIFKSLI